MEISWEHGFDNSSSPIDNGRKVPRGVFTGLCKAHDLQQQMHQDALSLPAISVGLRRWALQQEDVEKVAIGYIGANYSIAILFDKLEPERMSHLYIELEHIWSKFGEFTPLLYPLGPTQRESILLNSVGCRIVYPA